MFSSCVVVAGEHGRLDYRLCRPYLWLGRISVPAWLRFLNTEYVEVIFRGLLATKAVRSCFFVFFVVVFFAMAQLSSSLLLLSSSLQSGPLRLKRCAHPHSRHVWLFPSTLMQKSREAVANATLSSASVGGGSDEHVREAEEMLHDVCQRWCTSWWKRGLFLRVRKGEKLRSREFCHA